MKAREDTRRRVSYIVAFINLAFFMRETKDFGDAFSSTRNSRFLANKLSHTQVSPLLPIRDFDDLTTPTILVMAPVNGERASAAS